MRDESQEAEGLVGRALGARAAAGRWACAPAEGERLCQAPPPRPRARWAPIPSVSKHGSPLHVLPTARALLCATDQHCSILWDTHYFTTHIREEGDAGGRNREVHTAVLRSNSGRAPAPVQLGPHSRAPVQLGPHSCAPVQLGPRTGPETSNQKASAENCGSLRMRLFSSFLMTLELTEIVH